METEPLWGDLPVQERLRRKFLMEKNEEKRVEVPLPEVVVPGHPVPAEFLPKQPREVLQLLESKGRTVGARHGQHRVKGTEFKSGKRKGQLRPDKYIDYYAIATLDKRLPVLSAQWKSDTAVVYARVRTIEYVDLWPENVTEIKRVIEENF